MPLPAAGGAHQWPHFLERFTPFQGQGTLPISGPGEGPLLKASLLAPALVADTSPLCPVLALFTSEIGDTAWLRDPGSSARLAVSLSCGSGSCGVMGAGSSSSGLWGAQGKKVPVCPPVPWYFAATSDHFPSPNIGCTPSLVYFLSAPLPSYPWLSPLILDHVLSPDSFPGCPFTDSWGPPTPSAPACWPPGEHPPCPLSPPPTLCPAGVLVFRLAGL